MTCDKDLYDARTAIKTFDTGAKRQNLLGKRYDLLPANVVSLFTNQLACWICPAHKIACRLLETTDTANAFVKILASLGALIHLERTGQLSDSPSIQAIEAYAEAMTKGVAKYGEDNWTKGIPESNLVQHAVNHLLIWESGDKSEDHLAHAFWNVAAIVYFRCDEKRWNEINGKEDAK